MKSVSNGYTYLASADHSKVVSSRLFLKDAINNVMRGCESLLQNSHKNTQLSHLLTQMTSGKKLRNQNISVFYLLRGSREIFLTSAPHPGMSKVRVNYRAIASGAGWYNFSSGK